MQWQPIHTAPVGRTVLTKIHNERGERNIQKLILKQGRWWIEKANFYVYYTPTHWKY